MKQYPTLIESKDLAGFNSADEKFHDNIARYSENILLEMTLRNQHGQIRIVRRYDHIRATSFNETYEEHSRILEHMICGEITEAQQAMSQHITQSMSNILAIVRKAVYSIN